MKKRVGILISGRGSNMMALVEAARTAGYPAEIASIISSAPDAPGLAWATAQGLPARAIDHRAHPTREAFDAAVHAALTDAGVELVALAGFMRIQSKAFVERWQGRQLNIHPSLLPLFKGLHPHRQALEAGVKVSGCTVHFVTPEMDSGPIVAQAAVPVLDGDTSESLAARVLAAEHRLYPHALALVASGRASIEGGRVRIDAGPDAWAHPDGCLFSPQP
jgi:phosphoribosylglycinamide formyltransferase 1